MGMSGVIRRKRKVGAYVHTGSFNRLAGRPDLPGSWHPESYYLKYRLIGGVCGGIFLGIGFYYMLF